MLTAERLCTHIIQLLHAPIRVYDGAGNRTAIYMDYGEQQDVLDCDKEYLAQLLEKGRQEAPVLHLEMEEIIYGTVRGGESLYLMGPCCLSRDPVAAARRLVRRHKMDPRKPYRISIASLSDFTELLLMLHEQLTGVKMDTSELLLRSFCDQRFELAMQEKVHEVFYTFQEAAAVYNPYDQELREQTSIRTGDLDALHRSFEETYVGRLGILSHDPLRNAKDLFIVLTTLASRFAIAGGVLPEVAYSMSDAYIQRAEEIQNVG